MKAKTALFTRQPKELLDAITSDAKFFGLTKDGVVQAALGNHFLFKKEERRRLYQRIPKKIFGRPLAVFALFLSLSAQAYTADQLANAIRIEEGNNPHWLYGIHHKGSAPLTEAEARKRCLQTIAHAQRDFRQGDFISFLSARYCPANSNSWSRNIKLLIKNESR